MTDTLFILAVLAGGIAVSEWLAANTWFRHLGSALLVIVLVAIVANLGLIPTYSPDVAVYDVLLGTVGQLAIFWLLLRVRLSAVLRAGGPMILLFLIGAGGTMIGVVTGLRLFGGAAAFGELHWALGGMFVGTYIGGSINFNAIALEYGVIQDGVLYTGAAAVDSAYTTVWMAATVALPRLLGRFWPASRIPRRSGETDADTDDPERETVDPLGGALLLGLGCTAVWLAAWLHDRIATLWGLEIPTVLVLTTLALMLAQSKYVHRMPGIRVIGWLAVMLFLATIGTLCDVASVRRLGDLGPRLMGFVGVVVALHGLIVFGAARLLRFDPEMAAVASQANIGGGTSALALARSLVRPDLALPAVLIGALGNALGTFLGFWVASILR